MVKGARYPCKVEEADRYRHGPIMPENLPNLTRTIKQYAIAGYPTRVVQAPADAVLFTHMLVVYGDDECRRIRQVSMYDCAADRFVAMY